MGERPVRRVSADSVERRVGDTERVQWARESCVWAAVRHARTHVASRLAPHAAVLPRLPHMHTTPAHMHTKAAHQARRRRRHACEVRSSVLRSSARREYEVSHEEHRPEHRPCPTSPPMQLPARHLQHTSTAVPSGPCGRVREESECTHAMAVGVRALCEPRSAPRVCTWSAAAGR
jgi:hypothetical protein